MKPPPYPAVHSTSQCRCFEPLCFVSRCRTHAPVLSGGPVAEEVTFALDPTALWAEAVLGGRGDQGVALGKASSLQRMAGMCPYQPTHDVSGSSSLTCCPCLCHPEMSVPGAVSLSSRLLPVHVHRPYPTCCVLSSALQTPPGSRTLPRGISVCAESKGYLRQVLWRSGVSVPPPEQRNSKQPLCNPNDQ